MNIAKHISFSFVIGNIFNNFILVFILSFISHIILDIIPYRQYKTNAFNPDRYILITEIIISVILIYLSLSNLVVLFAIFGGILPDVIDGLFSIINRERYQKGKHLFFFHAPRKNIKYRTKKQTLVLSIICFLFALLIRR